MPAPGSASGIVNALTIDVEDYFQVSALAPYVARSDWNRMDGRVERNVDRILRMLSDHGARATFFTLGWIGERYPQMVRRIVAGGHELASHGFSHARASEQSPHAFLADIQQAKRTLENVAGVEVRGYRAPSFSIGPATPWAFDCLRRAGYSYSSSIYPIRHDHYGAPHAPRFTHAVCGDLLEVPVATARLFGCNWPAGGGGYFRLMPYALSRWLLSRVNRIDAEPAVFYFHPWEIDPLQPRISGIDLKTKFRHYLNLGRMERRLACLLRDFAWGRIDEVIRARQSMPSARAAPQALPAP